MSIKKSQAILKRFIDLKSAFSLRWAQKTKPCFVTLRTFLSFLFPLSSFLFPLSSFLFPLSPFPTYLGKIEASLLTGQTAGHLVFWRPAVDLNIFWDLKVLSLESSRILLSKEVLLFWVLLCQSEEVNQANRQQRRVNNSIKLKLERRRTEYQFIDAEALLRKKSIKSVIKEERVSVT